MCWCVDNEAAGNSPNMGLLCHRKEGTQSPSGPSGRAGMFVLKRPPGPVNKTTPFCKLCLALLY